MKDDIAKIIAMVQEDKIDAEEAGELISALKTETSEQKASDQTKSKMIKVRVTSDGTDNVHVNIPVGFVKTFLKMGHGIAASIPQAKQYADDIDIDLLLNAIDRGETGKIIDVQSDEGDLVAVYIE